jgi:hypothetical protein
LGRDPIEEKGGLNLYGFCQNNPGNGFDNVGQYPVFINGNKYEVVPVLKQLFNPSSSLVAMGATDWSWDPGKWGLSVNLFYNSSTGFGFGIAPSNYVFVAIPQVSGAPSSPVLVSPPSIQKPIVPAPAFSASNTRTVDQLISHLVGGLNGTNVMMFFNPDATGNEDRREADGRYFSATADAFADHGLTSPTSSYADLMAKLTSSYYRPRSVGSIVLVDHANPNGMQYGGTNFDDAFYQAASAYFGRGTNRTIIAFGCAIGEQWDAVVLMAQYAQKWNLNIIVPTMKIGYSLSGGMIPNAQVPGLNWIRLSPGSLGGANAARLDAFGNQAGPSSTIPFEPGMIPPPTESQPLPAPDRGITPVRPYLQN